MHPRKRRTVLWLSPENYEFLESIATRDNDSKCQSMSRLLRALRNGNITSFLKLTIEQPSPVSNVVKMRRIS